jgi:hypothetical protein
MLALDPLPSQVRMSRRFPHKLMPFLPALCLLAAGLGAAAERAEAPALEAVSADLPAQFDAAVALFRQHKLSEAIALLEPLARSQGEWGDAAREYLGACYLEAEDYPRAIQLLAPLVEADPRNRTCRWLLARSLYGAGRYAEALPHFQRLLAEGAGPQEAARYYLAATLEGLGRRQAARQLYLEGARQNSDWAGAAQQAEQELAGRKLRVRLDLRGGYDSGILNTEEGAAETVGQDYFAQQNLNLAARVWRSDRSEVWLGFEHYGIEYPTLSQDNYLQESIRALASRRDVGPCAVVALEYRLRYSDWGQAPYRLENRLEPTAVFQSGRQTLRVNLSGARNEYYGVARDLRGWDLGARLGYRLRLPCWDHELRLGAESEYRWSADDFWNRLTQRGTLAYRAKIWRKLYGVAEGAYRRNDYPSSAGLFEGTRYERHVKQCLTGAVWFEAEVQPHVQLNCGYLREREYSTIRDDRYQRQQVTVGISFTF